MTVVSNASPLIAMARIGRLDSLKLLYQTVHISSEVYQEVVVAGAGMPGASAVARSDWIRTSAVQDAAGVAKTASESGLGLGEVGAILLARELAADLVLMDEWKGRRLASRYGLAVVGCIGILEELYRRSAISDLRQTYLDLLSQKLRVDLRALQGSLKHFGLPPL